ncbi:MAG: type IV secretion system protein [Alphaproteobacteria bacterium]|nr:type IV secretion system protein [Alphaproteobacteria bacterium]
MISSLIKNQKARSQFAVYWAKLWMTIASISIAINLFIVLTLVQMAPKLKMIAQILPSPMHTLDHIQIDTLPVKGLLNSTANSNRINRELLDEMLIRYYIDKRISHFPDKIEMNSRWGAAGDIRKLSSPSVYSKFAKNMKEKIEQITSTRETRSVDITRISKLGNIYTVEFDVFLFNPYDPVVKPKIQKRIATITINHHPNRHVYSRILSNPFGFYVEKYDEDIKK